MSTPTATRTFDYLAVDAEGKRSKGKLEASSEAVATAQLRVAGRRGRVGVHPD